MHPESLTEIEGSHDHEFVHLCMLPVNLHRKPKIHRNNGLDPWIYLSMLRLVYLSISICGVDVNLEPVYMLPPRGYQTASSGRCIYISTAESCN